MATAVGSATYNSQKPLREGPARAANRSPGCRAIKNGREAVSVSLGYGGESGRPREDHRGSSTAILLRWGSPLSSAPPHRRPVGIAPGGGVSVRSEVCEGQRGLAPALLLRPGPALGE